jgi:hypothetical protein
MIIETAFRTAGFIPWRTVPVFVPKQGWTVIPAGLKVLPEWQCGLLVKVDLAFFLTLAFNGHRMLFHIHPGYIQPKNLGAAAGCSRTHHAALEPAP